METEEHATSISAIIVRRAFVLFVFVGMMWTVRIFDSFRSDGSSVAGVGVIPRTSGALTGILAAPLIHANWPHLFANTLPLLVLGSLILVGGVTEFLYVTVICVLSAGAGTWLFGETANHIGASGVVFGYVGYLLFRSVFNRDLWFVLLTLVVASMYGSALLWSVVPRSGISWSAHFFGFLGGVLAAWMRGRVSQEDS